MKYSERQRIEQQCFNDLVHEKWDGKSLYVDRVKPPFSEYSGDLLDGAKKYLGQIEGKKILEIGCGNGELSVWLAKNGAEVWGVDISDESIRIAENRSKENTTLDKTRFYAQPAEVLPFEDNFFDIVFINVTLHHLEIETALKEFYRVMKPSGLLVAIEPLTFSEHIQNIRTSKWFTKLYPVQKETPTERILVKEDLNTIKKIFFDVTYVPFRIFSPFIFKAKPLFRLLSKLFFAKEKDMELRQQACNRANQRFDENILRLFPFMKIFSRYVVIKGQKK